MSVGVTTVTTLQVTANTTASVKPVYLSGLTNNSAQNYGIFNIGTLNYTDTRNLAIFVDSVNNYTQAIVQNTNSGSNASTDFIVSNDLSGATNYYGDFGINSSGFVGTGPWDDANGTYLYASAGSLSIGTDDNKDVRIATGSAVNTPVTRITVKGTTGNVGINSSLPTSALDVIGNVKIIGVTTSTTFSGSGTNLTGIVTSIVAGSNITISGSTGQVTINATSGGGTQTLDQTLGYGNNSTKGMSIGIITATGATLNGTTSAGIFKGTQISEYCNFSTPVAGIVTCDCSTGQVFELTMTNANANFTINLTNLNLSSNYCATVVVILKQQAGAGYYPSALQIGGSAQTYNTNWFWQGGSTPTGTAGKRDVVSYSITNNGGTYTTYAQLVSFG